MTQHEISSLKTYFDEIAETNGDDECRAGLDKLFDSKAELASFVASRRGGGAGQFIGFLKGSISTEELCDQVQHICGSHLHSRPWVRLDVTQNV